MTELRLTQKRLGEHVGGQTPKLSNSRLKEVIETIKGKYSNINDFNFIGVEKELKAGWLYFDIKYNPGEDNTIKINKLMPKEKLDIHKEVNKRLDEIMKTYKYTNIENKLSLEERYTLRVETKLAVLIEYLEDNI